MLIGGLEKLSLIDYPGKLAAVVFTSGCNFRCPFCQNPELVNVRKIKKQPRIKEDAFFDFLKSRQGLLEGVCLTGGEPTIQTDLIDFVRKIKRLGFLVKLDTNGSNPEILKKLFQEKLLDFIAMDIKSSKERYSEAINQKIDFEKIQESIKLIKQSKIDYEFRTTLVPGLVDEGEIRKIGQWLKGAESFVLQQFRPEKTLDPAYQKIKPYSQEKLKKLFEIVLPYFPKVELRGI
ncbi:MAG: anaerobic ribonucleoside-triphosphate reductase activating protein [Patescibacteria group bacterium]